MEAINDFSCFFMDYSIKKKVRHWYIRISKDGMSISNPYKPIQLTLQYEKYPEFSMIDATYHAGGVEVEGHFESDKFKMTVYYKDYYEDDGDEITHQDGNILVNTDSMNFSFPVPYNLAKALIKLGQGITTQLEGAIHVKNY
jgi:hypothetical protein